MKSEIAGPRFIVSLFYCFYYDHSGSYIPTCYYFSVSIFYKIKIQFESYDLSVCCEMIHFLLFCLLCMFL